MGLFDKKTEFTNFDEFHNLDGIKEKDALDRKEGIKTVYTPEQMPSTLQIGKNKDEIKETLKTMFEGIDEETLENFANQIFSQGFTQEISSKLEVLKAETIDTSALEDSKTLTSSENPFVQKVPTPTINSTPKKEDINKDSKDEINKNIEGQEI